MGRLTQAATVLLLVLAATGCGGGTGTVSGKVYYRDEPLGGGQVTFVAADGTSRPSAISPDGSYTIDKIPAGTVKIFVETESARRNAATNVPKPPPGVELPPQATASAAYGGARGGKYIEIPKHYNDPEKPELEYTVQKGSQQYDIKLK